MTNYKLWLESFAELLNCDARPASIAVAIQSLQDERDRIAASIPEHRKNVRDTIIREMRNASVNCGQRSSCAVAYWFRLSDEIND